MVRFTSDFNGGPLRVGTFQIGVEANDFEFGMSALLPFRPRVHSSTRDVALIPLPFSFSNVQPCTAIAPQGNTCTYSAQLNNNTTAPVTGVAFSTVQGFETRSPLSATTFEASTANTPADMPRRALISIPARSSQVVTFRFDVPSFIRSGAVFCTMATFGIDPFPLVNTNNASQLFCVRKVGSVMELLDPIATEQMFRALEPRRELMPIP